MRSRLLFATAVLAFVSLASSAAFAQSAPPPAPTFTAIAWVESPASALFANATQKPVFYPRLHIYVTGTNLTPGLKYPITWTAIGRVSTYSDSSWIDANQATQTVIIERELATADEALNGAVNVVPYVPTPVVVTAVETN